MGLGWLVGRPAGGGLAVGWGGRWMGGKVEGRDEGDEMEGTGEGERRTGF